MAPVQRRQSHYLPESRPSLAELRVPNGNEPMRPLVRAASRGLSRGSGTIKGLSRHRDTATPNLKSLPEEEGDHDESAWQRPRTISNSSAQTLVPSRDASASGCEDGVGGFEDYSKVMLSAPRPVMACELTPRPAGAVLQANDNGVGMTLSDALAMSSQERSKWTPAYDDITLDNYLGLVVSSDREAHKISVGESSSTPKPATVESPKRRNVKRKPVPAFDLGELMAEQTSTASCGSTQWRGTEALVAARAAQLNSLPASPKPAPSTAIGATALKHSASTSAVSPMHQVAVRKATHRRRVSENLPVTDDKPKTSWTRTLSLRRRKSESTQERLSTASAECVPQATLQSQLAKLPEAGVLVSSPEISHRYAREMPAFDELPESPFDSPRSDARSLLESTPSMSCARELSDSPPSSSSSRSGSCSWSHSDEQKSLPSLPDSGWWEERLSDAESDDGSAPSLPSKSPVLRIKEMPKDLACRNACNDKASHDSARQTDTKVHDPTSLAFSPLIAALRLQDHEHEAKEDDAGGVDLAMLDFVGRRAQGDSRRYGGHWVEA